MIRATNFLVLSFLTGGLSAIVHAAESTAPQNPGGPAEPIRMVSDAEPNFKSHDGGLPPVVGVHNIQVLRANRTHPNAEGADGFGWTYNHAPMLCYWNGEFYLEYLSDPVGEHVPPGQTLLVESTNGYHWSRPRVVFPSYKVSDGLGMSVSHQRMGFYVAPDGRLFVLAFYGFAPRPNNGEGVGRAVRELHKDGTLGPVYFIRYNRHAGFNEGNTPYPFYQTSEDKGFVAACDALLANKLMTQQWWEEDRAQDGFFAIAGREEGFDAKALSFFHRKDGAVAGLWKKRWAALSFDEGKSWTEPVRIPTLITGSAKTWGQRTDDGHYALAFDPHGANRWPLVTVSGDNGIVFDDMLVVHGEIPYPRYDGHFKSIGPQYVRGIAEGTGNPPGSDMWLTYSVNKEDIWISRVPVPIRGAVDRPINDNFDDPAIGPAVPGWNVYSPAWAPVSVASSPDEQDGHCLKLEDEDRYDYAKAARVFPAADQVELSFRVRAEKIQGGQLQIEVLNRHGNRALNLQFSENGIWQGDKDSTGNHAVKLADSRAKTWLAVKLKADAPRQRFIVYLDGKEVIKAPFLEHTPAPLERLCFRTGPFRNYDAHEADLLIDNERLGDRLDGDEKVPAAIFYADDVRSE